MNMAAKVDRRVPPHRTDPVKFGRGRRVGNRDARNIANAVWHRYHQACNGVSRVTDPDKLAQIIWEECGREIRGLANLTLIETYLCDM